MPATTAKNNAPENRADAAYFELQLDGFQRACAAVGGSIDQFIKIGDSVVCLRFAGQGLLSYLTPALAHLATDETSDPDLTICLWDSASTETPLAPLLDWFLQEVQKKPYELLSPRHEAHMLTNARVPVTFDLWSRILNMMDTERDVAIYWTQDATQLPYHEHGAPLRTILNWWLSRQNLQCVHAAAVGTATGGVLLAGKGGSGKSTTALSCLSSELLYASDDYCLITNRPAPYAYSLYNTAKLNGLRDLQRQPHFLNMIHNPDQIGSEKLMMFLAQHMSHKLASGFPLRAVLVPQVTDKIVTRLTPISSGRALKALAPTTMYQLPGAAQRSFRSMAQLVRQLPCYHIELGSEISAVPETIIQLLKSLEAAYEQ